MKISRLCQILSCCCLFFIPEKIKAEESIEVPVLENTVNFDSISNLDTVPKEDHALKESSTRGFFIDLNLLYWEPRIEGFALGQFLDGAFTPAGLKIKDNYIDLNFKRDFGSRIGLGYIFDKKSQYKAGVDWTYFHSKADNNIELPLDNISLIKLRPNWLPLIIG